MPFKPEVLVEGRWSRNGLVFASRHEAEQNAKDLMWRWMNVQDSRAAEVDDPVNYAYVDGVLHCVEGAKDPSPRDQD